MAEKEKKTADEIKKEAAAAQTENAGQTENTAQAENTELDGVKKELESVKKELESTRAEINEKNNLSLRIAAEYDNFRKRSGKEKEQLFNDAYACAVSAFLPVFDNLERATCYEEGDGLKKGVELVLKQLSEIMKKQNITEINPLGEAFNPELHNAVMHIEDDSLGENTVVEVLQKGYIIGDRVIRHAMVKVAN